MLEARLLGRMAGELHQSPGDGEACLPRRRSSAGLNSSIASHALGELESPPVVSCPATKNNTASAALASSLSYGARNKCPIMPRSLLIWTLECFLRYDSIRPRAISFNSLAVPTEWISTHAVRRRSFESTSMGASQLLSCTDGIDQCLLQPDLWAPHQLSRPSSSPRPRTCTGVAGCTSASAPRSQL